MEHTTYTENQATALDRVLSTNRTHAGRTGEWMSINYIDRDGAQWPAVVELTYWAGPATCAVAAFPGLTPTHFTQALNRHRYFTTNLGGCDVMTPRDI